MLDCEKIFLKEPISDPKNPHIIAFFRAHLSNLNKGRLSEKFAQSLCYDPKNAKA